MNRFQRQLEVAMQAINNLQDEHLIVQHELRDVLADNRRMNHALYERERRKNYTDTMVARRDVQLTRALAPASIGNCAASVTLNRGTA